MLASTSAKPFLSEHVPRERGSRHLIMLRSDPRGGESARDQPYSL